LQADGLQAVTEHDRHADKGAGLEFEKGQVAQGAPGEEGHDACGGGKAQADEKHRPADGHRVLHQQKVPPQTMVISTSTHSALLSRRKREEAWGAFGDVMILRTT
jgi:hypothetical protein